MSEHGLLTAGLPPRAKYIVYQLEECPSTGRLHLQGYVQLEKKARLAQVKEVLMDPAAHLEVARGTPAENKAYCTKAETRVGEEPYEYGEMGVGRGERTDLVAAFAQAAFEGTANLELFKEYPKQFLLHANRLSAVRELSTPRDKGFETELILVIGGTGLGKSTWVQDRLADREHQLGLPRPYDKEAGRWWDGYTGTEDVHIADFSPGSIPAQTMKRLCDATAARLEQKCITNGVLFRSQRVYVSTQYVIDSWYLRKADRDAMKRRVTQVVCFYSLGRYNTYDSYRAFERSEDHAWIAELEAPNLLFIGPQAQHPAPTWGGGREE